MAAKKAATKVTAAPEPAAMPGISPELVEAREAALKAEPEVKEAPPDVPTISSELVEMRKEALAAEGKQTGAVKVRGDLAHRYK